MTEQKFDFAIETGVEKPQHANREGAQKYPYDHLEPGQSFFVPNKTTKQMTATTKHWRNKYPDRKFSHYTVVEERDGEKVTGVRIWRDE